VTADKKKEEEAKAAAEEKRKEIAFYTCTVLNMKPLKCKYYASKGECTNLACKFQHNFLTAKLAAAQIAAKSPLQNQITVCTDIVKITTIKQLWNSHASNGFTKQLINVETVFAPELIKKYNEYKQKCETAAEKPIEEMWGFHGTPAKNIESIAFFGFDPQKFGSAVGQAFGTGAYFAFDPKISVSYCKGDTKMLLCKIVNVEEAFKYVNTHGYYVVRVVEAILPCFVVTFQ